MPEIFVVTDKVGNVDYCGDWHHTVEHFKRCYNIQLTELDKPLFVDSVEIEVQVETLIITQPYFNFVPVCEPTMTDGTIC